MLEKPITKQVATNLGNPNNYSLISPSVKLGFLADEEIKQNRTRIENDEERHIRTFTDKETGEVFYEMKPESNPKAQMLLSLFLKGVVNVTDIIKVDNVYYAHKQDFSKIESTENNIVPQLKADMLLLNLGFEDFDHKYYERSTSERDQIIAKQDGLSEHHNLITDEANGKYVFFDFNNPSWQWLEKIKKTRDPEMLEKIFEAKFTNKYFSEDINKDEILETIKNKSTTLLNNYGNLESDAFKQIVKRSEIELSENDRELVLNGIKLRLQTLVKVISKLKPNNNKNI